MPPVSTNAKSDSGRSFIDALEASAFVTIARTSAADRRPAASDFMIRNLCPFAAFPTRSTRWNFASSSSENSSSTSDGWPFAFG